ncbi:kinase-like domain, phloem protein 2-like protein [Tanacetum coccineum]
MSSSSKQLNAADMSFIDYVDSLRIPYEKIELATNNFTDANLLPTQSPSSSFFPKLIYKGQLEQSGGQLLDIVARKIPKEQDNIVFNELVTSYLLKHKNIHSIFKICGTDEPVIINKYEANGSLDRHLRDSNLTWMQRLHICVGVAHALSYIHDFSVIHGNIKSSKILLDENWEPKLNCFGFSMFIKKHQPHLTSKYNGALQYVDPEYVNTGCLTHKSDVFSFGAVLFEVMFGEIASVKDENNWYFAGLARSVYEEKSLDDKINIDLRKQMDLQSLDIFSETAYYCLKEVSSQRPDMVQIVKNLEASLELQQNHESFVMFTEDSSSNLDKVDLHIDLIDLSHLKLSARDITSATNNFAVENIIEKFKLGIICKGRLLHFEQFIDIIVKRFYTRCIKDESKKISKKIWTEISMLSSLEHKNLVSLVGFYEDVVNKIIIYKKEATRSLKTYLSDHTLTWMQRLKICVGVAKALSYIYYDPGRDFSVIHCNIMSSNILLDDKWEPKLSGFELSLKNTVARRHRLILTRDVIKNVYLDPRYKKTGGLTHKSDVYSFGVVLFQVLCERSAGNEDEAEYEDEDDYEDEYENEDELREGLFSQLNKSHLEDMIDEHLQSQMDLESFKIFSETAYWCIREDRADRPYIDQVVSRLEKALELQWEYENPVNRTSNQLKVGKDKDGDCVMENVSGSGIEDLLLNNCLDQDSGTQDCGSKQNSGGSGVEILDKTRFKSYVGVTNNNIPTVDRKLADIPTEMDDNGSEIVVFNEAMIEEGSKRWELTIEGIDFVVNNGPWMDENVPLEAWTAKGISALASRVGKPLVMDHVTATLCMNGVGRFRFAKVMAEVSASKSLPSEIEVVYRNGSKEEICRKIVKVDYDWKPLMCSECCVFGHNNLNSGKQNG